MLAAPCQVKLLATQLDRNAGFLAPKGSTLDVLAYCQNPAAANELIVAKCRGFAFKIATEPLETDTHVFYVPLGDIEQVGQ